MATVDGIVQGWGRSDPVPDVNNLARGWLGEILRRAGAPGAMEESFAELYPRKPGPGRPYRPNPVRLYLGWRSTSLQTRLVEEHIAAALSRLYGVPITKRELSRNRAELRQFADTVRRAPWSPLRADQPLNGLSAPIANVDRNTRIGDLRQSKKAMSVIMRRLPHLYSRELRQSARRGRERMEGLERSARHDSVVMAAAEEWERKTFGRRSSTATGSALKDMVTARIAAEDMVTACITAYELELERLDRTTSTQRR
jgi:hypothetical protein